MRYRSVTAAIAAACIVCLPAAALAASTSERLDALERKLDSRSLLDMLNRIDQLQRDLQLLRGEIEEQAHTAEEMQRRQREQYMDIDRRLQQLETGQPGGAPPGGLTTTTSPPVMPSMAPPPESPAPVMPSMAPPPVASTPPPRVMSPGAAGAPPTAQEQASYDKSLAILREGRYTEAADAFNRFLTAYPQSQLADNASYWLGETYYVTRDFDRALETFKGLVSRYPQSPKVSDSRLKIGYIQYEKQDWRAARLELNGVATDYPGTTAARLAVDRLDRMRKEGH